MYEDKLKQLRIYLQKQALDAILISNFFNILYFSGFETLTKDEREGFLFVTKKNAYLFTDARYTYSGSAAELRYLEPNNGLLNQLSSIYTNEMITAVDFEADDLKYNEYELINKTLATKRFVPTQGLGIMLREIKTSEELASIEKACKLTGVVLNEFLPYIKIGLQEREAAVVLERIIKGKGYGLAFDPIIAVDENSATPHYNTKNGSGSIAKNSVILVDFGISYDNYVSDITRMIFMKEAPNEAIEAYHVLHEVQKQTVKKVKICDSLKDIDIFCRDAIQKKGYPNYNHSTGHGIGLEIHEYPKVSFNSSDKKRENQVFTIEPGIYMNGKWGLRLEDSVVVQNGEARILTPFPKELLLAE